MKSATIEPDTSAVVTGGVRSGRIVIGAVLLEVALVVVAVPLLYLVDNPFVAGADGVSGNFTTFFATVAVACFAAGGVFGAWVARPLSSRFVLHGVLTGIVATALYLAICSIPPSSIAAVATAYGPFWFLLVNGLRIGGAAAGAACGPRTST